MATINDRKSVRTLIQNGGAEPDDSVQVYSITVYINAWGGIAYGLAFNQREDDGYNTHTDYVNYPTRLWSRMDGPTKEGLIWMDQYDRETGEKTD
jgi:hypothetical protein